MKKRALVVAGKVAFALCLIGLLGIAFIGMDPHFIEGVDSADFDARLDEASADAGYDPGCWITGLPISGLDPQESWMYSLGFFSRLAQHGYTFSVNGGQQVPFLMPWQFGAEIKHCSPFVPKRQPLPGEVNL